MRKRNKTILFFVSVGLFLLITPLTIFYSQGYRFDFKEKRITQTGGLFLRVRPKKAKIYIDNRLRKETDFLFGSVLIENLLPKKYKISVGKQGFQKWEKELKIEEKKVTEAKNILLWPENLSFETLTGAIEKLFLSPDKTKIIFLEMENSQEIISHRTSTSSLKKQALKLYDLKRKVKSSLIDEDNFREKGLEILEIIWGPYSQKILIETAVKEQIKYWLLEILPRPKLTSLDFLPQGISDIKFSPENSQKIFFRKLEKNNLSSLFEADLKEKKVNPSPLLENFLTFTLTENSFYWLNPDGFLYKSSLKLQGKEKMNQLAFPVQKGEIEYKIFVFGENIFLQEKEKLFFLNESSKSFEEILEKVLQIESSPDNKKLALAKEHEIWIYYLEKELSQPQREKGEKIFLTRFGQNIGKVTWINPSYLLFSLKNTIKIIEIDNRDKPQVWEIVESKEPDFFFNQDEKKLYLLSEKTLFSSEALF